jgi:ribosomal protein S18 acetylase RimI-like enzyme
MSWTVAQKSDMPAITGFLTCREWECVALTSRLRAGGRARLPAPGKAKLALYREDKEIRRIVYMSRNGFIIPYLPGFAAYEKAEALGELFFRECGIITILIGLTSYVDIFASRIGALPLVSVDYHLMKRDGDSRPLPPADIPGLIVRRARPDDLEALLPLQEAYEREEILINQNDFNAAKTRSELKYNLQNQLIYLADYRGRIVAKGGTNARGFTYDQIGGVFTREDLRGRKFAHFLMCRLLGGIREDRKKACLFVKKNNLPAQGLYAGLGFRIAENYRISYFQL